MEKDKNRNAQEKSFSSTSSDQKLWNMLKDKANSEIKKPELKKPEEKPKKEEY